MWAIVEIMGIIALIIIGLLVSFALVLMLIQYIKELLVELDWIHPKADKDDEDNENWEEYTCD